MTGPAGAPALPLRAGCTGPAVRDLHQRLAHAGHATSGGSVFDSTTEAAVAAFQRARGLSVDGICGPETWSALIEAGYRLGDRLLYHRRPMLRGDDVADLQRRLGALGFDTGRVDGIFGPDTEAALRDFQRNAGLTTDAVCGRDTLAALGRLGDRTDGAATVSELRQSEVLRDLASATLEGRALAVGETGGLAVLVDTVAHHLTTAGARVLALHHPDESVHAGRSNDFGAHAYLGVHLAEPDDVGEPHASISYFAVPGYTSVGGHHLAEAVRAPLVGLGWVVTEPAGMRLRVLRETRMPAVRCTLGPPAAVVTALEEITAALVDAIQGWIALPVTPPSKG